MELNSIFRIDDYDEAYAFVQKNNFATIMEIESDSEGRRFQIRKKPEPTLEEVLENLRLQRNEECFSVINRGQLWYETLTVLQKEELRTWYQAWLNVTETRIIPIKPLWLR